MTSRPGSATMLVMLSFVVAVLYYVCFALLMGLALFIVGLPQVRKRLSPAKANLLTGQRRAFLLLLLSLLLWQATLMIEAQTPLPWLQLWLSRVNFASVAVAVSVLWRFVGLVAQAPGSTTGKLPAGWSWGLLIATVLIVALTLLTPWIVAGETVVNGVATTSFGPLFPLYLLHVLGFLAATLVRIVRAWRRAKRDREDTVRGQLTLIGSGILATSTISLITNALLPYGLGDFRFCDLGTLSTLLFLIAVAYAVFVHGLFDLRVVVGKTIASGVVLAFVLGGYSSGVFLITQYLSSSGTSGTNDNPTQLLVVFLAFSFDPLRRLLEKKVDKLLFGDKGGQETKRRRSREQH